MNLILLADGLVGEEITKWLIAEYPQDLSLVVTKENNDINIISKENKIDQYIYDSDAGVVDRLNYLSIESKLGILIWWPYIIKNPLMTFPTNGFINTHPSFLPFNRGKNPNFWAIVEQAPYGVSLHFVDDGVDTGPIVFQKQIPICWEDNGESLYRKAQHGTIQLFKDNYSQIRELTFPTVSQTDNVGSFHKTSELEMASRLELEKQYVAKDLINLLRARTFHGYPSCWFESEGCKYEVRIEIRKKH